MRTYLSYVLFSSCKFFDLHTTQTSLHFQISQSKKSINKKTLKQNAHQNTMIPTSTMMHNKSNLHLLLITSNNQPSHDQQKSNILPTMHLCVHFDSRFDYHQMMKNEKLNVVSLSLSLANSCDKNSSRRICELDLAQPVKPVGITTKAETNSYSESPSDIKQNTVVLHLHLKLCCKPRRKIHFTRYHMDRSELCFIGSVKKRRQ